MIGHRRPALSDMLFQASRIKQSTNDANKTTLLSSQASMVAVTSLSDEQGRNERARLGEGPVAAALVGVRERGLAPVRTPDLAAARAWRHAQPHVVAHFAARPAAAGGLASVARIAAAAAAIARARTVWQPARAALRLPSQHTG